jgi:hypothetical protein
MYEILRVGTHSIHFVVFKLINFHLQTILRLFVLLLLSLPGTPSGQLHYEFITQLLQGLYKNANNFLHGTQECGQAEDFCQEPSCRRLANFVRPRASLPRTTKDKPAYRCMPIINGKKIFSRTQKCYLWRSQARDPEDSKSKPMVQGRECQADGEPSLVVGRGHVS